jgi:hypothetical protein
VDDSNPSQGIGDGLMDEGGGGETNITWPRLHSQVNAQLKKLHPHPCLKKSRVYSCIYNTHTCKYVCKSESSLAHLWTSLLWCKLFQPPGSSKYNNLLRPDGKLVSTVYKLQTCSETKLGSMCCSTKSLIHGAYLQQVKQSRFSNFNKPLASSFIQLVEDMKSKGMSNS